MLEHQQGPIIENGESLFADRPECPQAVITGCQRQAGFKTAVTKVKVRIIRGGVESPSCGSSTASPRSAHRGEPEWTQR